MGKFNSKEKLLLASFAAAWIVYAVFTTLYGSEVLYRWYVVRNGHRHIFMRRYFQHPLGCFSPQKFGVLSIPRNIILRHSGSRRARPKPVDPSA